MVTRRQPDALRVRLRLELLAARCLPSAGPADPAPATTVPDLGSAALDGSTAPAALVRPASDVLPVNSPWALNLFNDTFPVTVIDLSPTVLSPAPPTSPPAGTTAVVGRANTTPPAGFAPPGPLRLTEDADVRQPGPPELWARHEPDASPPGPGGLLAAQRVAALAPETSHPPPPPPAPADPWTEAGEMWTPRRAPAVATRTDPPARSSVTRDPTGETRLVYRSDPAPVARPNELAGVPGYRGARGDSPVPVRVVVHPAVQSQYQGGELPPSASALLAVAPTSPEPSAVPVTAPDGVGELIARFATEEPGAVQYLAEPAPAAETPSEPEWRRAVRVAAYGAAVWVGGHALTATIRRVADARPAGPPPRAYSNGGAAESTRLRVETVDGSSPT